VGSERTIRDRKSTASQCVIYLASQLILKYGEKDQGCNDHGERNRRRRDESQASAERKLHHAIVDDFP
jgi:hypothetical protein